MAETRARRSGVHAELGSHGRLRGTRYLQDGAKKHFEEAMQRVIDKRNAADDATYGGAGGAP